MSNKILNPTYNEIHDACVYAALMIQELDWKFDNVIGVARGGLIPAVILSHLIGSPLVPVSYSSSRGKGNDKNHENVLPIIRGKKLLVVDDICDSGFTLSEITKYFSTFNNSVYSFVLFYKKQPVPLIVPTFGWRVLPADSDWVNFPFEVNTFIGEQEETQEFE